LRQLPLEAERLVAPGDPVFLSEAGSFRAPNSFRRQWRDATTDTGFEWVTSHSFRRTVATLLDRERTTDHAAAQPGHSDTAVTKTHHKRLRREPLSSLEWPSQLKFVEERSDEHIAKAHRAPDVSDVLQQLARPPVASSVVPPPAMGM